ncbi:MAG: NEW3 domain-containing protein [Candidatus ainarchaeum sp.]|nr:NEW3 domain-containing protein [Candidatus ainarchaeum sp.]
MKVKLLLACLLILLFAGFASAETVFEKNFQELGYQNFSVDSPGSTACTFVDFGFPSDQNAFSNGNYPILSLNSDFSPVASEAAKIDVNINNAPLAEKKTTEFKCNGTECWSRIWLPKENLLEGTNRLDICLHASNSTASINLKNSSKIGLYKTAQFGKQYPFKTADYFTTTADKSEMVIGDTTKVTVNLHNAGSGPAEIELKYARPIAEEKKAFVFIEGKAYAQGTIEPGSDIKIDYVIKPRVIGSITLPPAAVYYTNEFGEQEVIFSGQATIKIREPEKKVDAFIEKEKEINQLGQTVPLVLNVTSRGKDRLYNIEASIIAPPGISITGTQTKTIETIAPGETIQLSFDATASQAGTFDIGCKLVYSDFNFAESKCENSKLVFEQPGIGLEIIAVIILVIIGIAVYVYIMKSK